MSETIFITANEPHDGRVIFFEYDEAHPNGMGFLYARDGKVAEVAETGTVTELLRSKRVKQVSAPSKSKSDTESSASTPSAPSTATVLDLNDANTFTEANVRKASRKELDAFATAIDLDPTAYGNKNELADAVIAEMQTRVAANDED